MTTHKEIIAYEQEWSALLERVAAQGNHLRHFDYFVQLAQKHFSYEQISQTIPSVVILGTSIPEELVYAAGAEPYWILGGNSRTGTWAGDLVPRDTDPVSRSLLGFLDGGFLELAKNELLLIPIINDSSRKLAFLLRQAGRKVHTIDLPPAKNCWGMEKWLRQMELCAEALSAHTGRRISKRAMQWGAEETNACREQINRFLKVADVQPETLSGPCRMLILNSYYYTADREEWRQHLEVLTTELRQHHASRETEARNNILILGSPIYFPNYKIPFLIQDAGLHIRYQMDYTTQRLGTPKCYPSINAIIRAFYEQDCSGAYTQNLAMQNAVAQLIAKHKIDGVVYHVLKGQIEYDFELEVLEWLFAKYDLPVFRLETDYNPQDVEQLRIRLDAFMEMLTQRHYRKEGGIV